VQVQPKVNDKSPFLFVKYPPNSHFPGFSQNLALTSYPDPLLKRPLVRRALVLQKTIIQPITHKIYPVMKRRIHLIIAIICALCLYQTSLFAQPNQIATIVGPNTLCIPDCGTYEVVFSDTNLVIETMIWNTGGITSGTGSNPLVYCTDSINSPSTVILSVSGVAFGPNATSNSMLKQPSISRLASPPPSAPPSPLAQLTARATLPLLLARRFVPSARRYMR
jgi:hypothetical protein